MPKETSKPVDQRNTVHEKNIRAIQAIKKSLVTDKRKSSYDVMKAISKLRAACEFLNQDHDRYELEQEQEQEAKPTPPPAAK